jgi:MFS family permease
VLRNYLDLPRTIHILCVGTFINRAGTFVMMFLTFYLQERLQLGGLFATQAIGVFGLGTLLASIVGGQLADTIGRKTVMLVALLGGAGVLMVFGRITQPCWILAALWLFSFLSEMYRPAAQAMISDVVSEEQRPHAYGLMYIAINLGAAVAPLVGGSLATVAFEYLFWGDAATSAVYAIIIATSVSESLRKKPRESDANISAAASACAAYQRVLGDGVFMRFCLGTFLLSCVFMQAMSTLPLFMKSLGFGPDVYGRSIALNGLLVVLLQIPMTHWIRRFPRQRMLMAAAVTTGVGFGLSGVADTQLTFALTVVIWTLGELMQSPLVPSVVSDLAPHDLRARYFGLLTMCFSGGNLIAAPIGGWVLTQKGPAWLWGGCVAVGLLSAALFATVQVRPASGKPNV